MYQNELLDAYKQAQNYVQDKQIALDMNISASRISEFRSCKRYMTDSQAVFLAENAGIDPELALLGCHADRNDNPDIKMLWSNIAKKYNGLGFTAISMICGAIVAPLEPIRDYVLCMLC
ncbi:hypothetical protein HUO09_05005 [Vibrio sp. Y2-5]|uniref:DUF3693 domain-containing protein n=1 Tax=Vibrio sp. Y2-5 TaxID=2743977 RepID=UPI001661100C|nr:DUF3693 domain-containing protein [Vibrio sp. Y2-5]MBD0785688.1 hypothetical protein [Vibrio sp. Y2-5]